MKVAIYARVSTRDKDQNPDTQLVALREEVDRQGWQVVGEYVDRASARDMRGRVEWRKLLEDAHHRRFGRLLVLRLDRAFRSVADMHRTLEAWKPAGVELVSLRESFDTSTAIGRLMMNLIASLAEFELELTRERILDGLARARSEGKHCGRPKGSKDKKPRKKGGYRLRWARQAKSEGR